MPSYLNKRINNNIKEINHLIKINFIVAVYSSCFLNGTIYSKTTSATFERITIKDGLSQSTVNYIIQDKKGFMWFATFDGINKYDGYNFKVYKNIHNDSTSLSNNGTIYLYEDNEGYIWVVNNGNVGLNRFDPETEKFIRYMHNPDDSTSISSNEVYHVTQDRSGHIWICTSNALNLVVEKKVGDKKTISFKRFYNTSKTTAFTMAYENRNGKLLLFADYLYYFDRESNKIHKSNTFLSYCDKISITEDRDGNLYLGTTEHGIVKLVYDNKTKSYKRAPAGKINVTPNNRNYVIVDNKGHIWIASDSKGLYQYDKKEDRLNHFTNNETDLNSISDNSIYSLLIDRSGILWIGTFSQGLCKYNLYKKQFLHFKSIPGNKNTLSGNVISSIHSRKPGELWIGVDLGGGVNRFIFRNNKDPRVIHYKHDPKDNNTIAGNNVLCLVQRKNGEVWVGSAGTPLSKIIPEKSGTNELPIIKKFDIIKKFNTGAWTFSIHEDSEETIWGGTWDAGLWRYNDKIDKFIYFSNNPDNPSSICDNIIWAITEDNCGNIWIGGHGKGLSILPAKEKNKLNPEFINYKHAEKDPQSLSDNLINVFCQDRTGTMWIGTAGGLNKVIRKDNDFSNIDKDNELEFYSYHTSDGLPSEGITGIVEDNNGNLWLSTTNGISRFNPSEGSFINYDESDGLQSNEFWHNAYFKDQNGRIYFGGNNGLNAFYPDSIKLNPFLPQVVFTDIKILNKSVGIGEKINGDVIISKSISETSQIVFSYKNNILSLEFAALHYAQPDKNRYAYKMEGFDKEWNYVGNKRDATYTNLHPGTYIFRVKGSNNDGVWNEEGASLKIIITPPFWRTAWFRLILILLIILTAYGVHLNRVKHIVEYGRELEKKVAEKTKDLEAFAYIASHDLKEPLRGIHQLAGWLSEDYYDKLDKEGKENLEMLKERTLSMDNMIQGILEYSRVGRTEGKREKIDLNKLLKEVIDMLAPPDNIKIIVENKLPLYTADSTRLTELFENLLSNAIKYSGKPKGIIKVDCAEEKSEWKFSISDNGHGIEKKYWDKIFKIFQTLESDSKYKSTGIGLTIAKKIVDLYKGEIWVESEMGKGTTFYFTLPKQRK
jgi:signal transduction histidine kinase/ligand-binding sensor domain-containing protein